MNNVVFRLVWRCEIEAFEEDPFRGTSNAPANQHGMRTPRTVKVDDVPLIHVANAVSAEMIRQMAHDSEIGTYVGKDLQRHAVHEMSRSGWVENKVGLAIPRLVYQLEVAKEQAQRTGMGW